MCKHTYKFGSTAIHPSFFPKRKAITPQLSPGMHRKDTHAIGTRDEKSLVE